MTENPQFEFVGPSISLRWPQADQLMFEIAVLEAAAAVSVGTSYGKRF
jgi:hypothetical protein